MVRNETLSDVLEHLRAANLRRRQLSYDQIAQLSGVPKGTIAKWFDGTTAKPRNWRRLIKLAVALELSHAEVNDLLVAAGHPGLDELRRSVTSDRDRGLLAPWPPLEPPFRAENALDYFTDREAVLEELTQLLTASQPPALVSIEGMAGVGKTEIAATLARALREHFADGVLWVDMDNLDPLAKLGELARDLYVDLSRYQTVPDRSRAFREILQKKKVLLFLDGVAEDREVDPFVPPVNSPSAIVVTTRHQGLWATRRAHSVEIGDFTDADALELYRKVLGQSRVASETQALQTVAYSVGHLPIALDITAHLLKKNRGWTVTDLLGRIESSEGRITQLKMGTARSVASLFETSYEHLSSLQQTFFATLGVFAGSDFSTTAAAYVCEIPELQAEDLLIALTDLSLLKETAKGRYRLHVLLRDFARLKEPIAGVAERMVRFYVDYTYRHRHDLPAIAREIDNIRAALASARQRNYGWEDLLVRGVNAFYPYLSANGLLAEAREWLDSALVAARQISDKAGEARTLVHIANLERIAGNLDETAALLNLAAPLVEETQDIEAFCSVHQGMGTLSAIQGDFSSAELEWQRALSAARQEQSDRWVCSLLQNLSSVRLYRYELADATELLTECLELARPIEAWDQVAYSLSNLAYVETKRNDMAAANAYLRQSLELARRGGHRETIVNIAANLAATYIELEDYQSAAAYLLEALHQAEELGDVEALSRVTRNYGELYSKQGNHVVADEHFANALQYAREARLEVLTVTTLADWGERLVARGEYERSEPFFDEVITTADADDFPEFVGAATYGLAQIRAHQGDLEEACRLAQEALNLFAQIDDPRQADVKAFLAKYQCPDM